MIVEDLDLDGLLPAPAIARGRRASAQAPEQMRRAEQDERSDRDERQERQFADTSRDHHAPDEARDDGACENERNRDGAGVEALEQRLVVFRASLNA